MARNTTEISFVRAGFKPSATRRDKVFSGILSCANDWQCLVDYSEQHVIFPPSITATYQRPDIVIRSQMVKRVILIELTVPSEDNIADAAFRKKDQYSALADAWRLATMDN